MKLIRITTPGVYGLPVSDENPTGEYPIGHEFETEADLPEGWNGKYHVVERRETEGKTPVTNPAGGSDPLDGSVDDLAKHLDGLSDLNAVGKLLTDEKAGKNRKGAIAAIEARRDELLA